MTNLNHGTLGRCGCGSVGRRRASFSNEPICPKCMPMRTGMLHVTRTTLADLIGRERSVGTLTPAQREARRAFLR